MNIIAKVSNWYFKKEALPYWLVLFIDCAIVAVTGMLAYYGREGGDAVAHNFWPLVWGLAFTVCCYVVFFRVFHTYSGVIRYSSFVDLERVAAADVCGALLATAGGALMRLIVPAGWALFPGFFLQIVTLTSTVLLMWLERVIVKSLYDTVRHSATSRRTFIYGVKDGGVSIAKNINNQQTVEYRLRGFIDPHMQKQTLPEAVLMGHPVYPITEALEQMVNHHIEVLFVSPLQAEHFREQEDLINGLIENNIRIMMLPEEQEWDGHSELRLQTLHNVEVEDLLPRDKIEVDLQAIGRMLEGQVVMVTGAAGSIGYQMVRQVAKFNPKHLVLVDQAETPMHTVRLHMKNHYPTVPCETVVSSISNQSKMEHLFRTYKPAYVFHAAAYKHVPMMEDNPAEAVQNNVYGTRVIADLAVKYGTRKFVMISTDKAVNPTNVMGCSKRICEIYCQALNAEIERINAAAEKDNTQQTATPARANVFSDRREPARKNTALADDAPCGAVHAEDSSDSCDSWFPELRQHDGSLPVTQFVTTRFGNVLGSNGSVIPLFKKQIEQGGPLTVTHPDIIRYFMLIPEACRLVLQAGTMGKGGEIYVFDMGKPVRIADLAKRMIKLSGAKGIEIKYTGLRDGEKLFEEVLSDQENTKPTTHPKIMVAAVREYPYELALRNEKELYDLSFGYDDLAIVRKMQQIVPEYRSTNERYQNL